MGGGYFVRCTYDFDKLSEGTFWYVIKDSFGGLEELSSKMRNQVRKSLKQLDIEKITREELILKGYDIHKRAAEGYKVRTHVPTLEEFESKIRNLDENYEFWACYTKEAGKMVAFAFNHLHHDCCEYETMKAIPELQQKYYPFYGLIYEMNRYYLDELHLRYVNDGARSITEHSNIQPFLIEKFKFRKAYVRLKIVYKPWLKVAVNICFPIRKIIPIRKVRNFLRMEAMQRGLE